MAINEGTTLVKSWKGSYDFAVDGGALGTITLRSSDSGIPQGAYITHGLIDVTVAVASATGTVSAGVETTVDVLAATGQAGLTTGLKSVVPAATGATAIKTTTRRGPTITIATAALTAGKFDLILFYR